MSCRKPLSFSPQRLRGLPGLRSSVHNGQTHRLSQRSQIDMAARKRDFDGFIYMWLFDPTFLNAVPR